MGILSSIATGLASGVGSLIGGVVGAKTTKDANTENLKFQREQNEIERQRADNTLMRTVADAHRAGLSAFDAQPVPLGQTSAPQNDVGAISSSMGTLTSALGQTGTNTLNYVLESAKLEHNKNVDDAKLRIADAQATSENTLRSAQTEIANIQAQLAQKENMSFEKKRELENDLVAAQTKVTLAQEAKTIAETSIGLSQEERAKKLHDFDVSMKSIEIATLWQSYNNNIEKNRIENEYKQNQMKLNDATIDRMCKELKLEKSKVVIDAIYKFLGITIKTVGTFTKGAKILGL